MKKSKIMVVDDEQSMLDFLSAHLLDEGYDAKCFLDADEALNCLGEFLPDLCLVDVKMKPNDGIWLLEEIKKRSPNVIVIMMTAYMALEDAVEATKKGAFNYITKPFDINALRITFKNAFRHVKLALEKDMLQREVRSKYGFENFIGKAPAMLEVFEQIRKTSALDSTVLITGQSGTGKELVAKAIHYNSPRNKAPFISIDCSAIPETLLESELFGHMKGAFTGADKTKIGLFEAAASGSIFLDEIGDMPVDLQSKILRVLQEKEVRKIGSTESIPIHARIIAATNRDLLHRVKKGDFREDLYFRLNIINIHLPALSERKDDIPLLGNFIIKKIGKRLKKDVRGISQEAMRAFMAYNWPGNVRELENAIERALILSDSGFLDVSSLPDRITNTENIAVDVSISGSLKESVEVFEKKIIETVLDDVAGNQFKAARKLKMTRQSLQYKLKKYGLLKS